MPGADVRTYPEREHGADVGPTNARVYYVSREPSDQERTDERVSVGAPLAAIVSDQRGRYPLTERSTA